MKRVKATGELEISRYNDGDEHTMRVRVRKPGVGIVLELECDAEDFLLAITGWGGTSCTVDVDVDRLQRASEDGA